MEKELSLLENEVQRIRVDNKGLDCTKFDQEKLITEFRVKNEGLQKQLIDKETLIEKNQQMVESNNKQRVDNIYQRYIRDYLKIN
jgi:hypothetical protein